MGMGGLLLSTFTAALYGFNGRIGPQAGDASSASYNLHFYHSNGRKMLDRPLEPPSAYVSAPEGRRGLAIPFMGESNFDGNILIILGALLCALVCALGLNSMVRCALRCSRRAGFESPEEVAIRVSNTGMKRRALRGLPTVIYGSASELPEVGTDCPICLGDFVEGERVKVLPKCNHSFHVRCIDIWLLSHSSCPTCRHCILETSESKQAGDNASAHGANRNNDNNNNNNSEDDNGGSEDSWRAVESCVGQIRGHENLIIMQADRAFGVVGRENADAAGLEGGIGSPDRRL